MSGEAEKVNGYLETLKRLEPELYMVDRDATLTSIAISLKSLAESLASINHRDELRLIREQGSD